MKCLQKKYVDRFCNFAELRVALESYCHSNGHPALIPSAARVAELEAEMTAEDWTLRGFALGQLGDDTNSLESYGRALEKDQTYPGLNCNIATVLSRLGRREEALPYYQKEVELQAEEPMFRILLGEWYLSAGRTEEGLAAIRVATQLDPGNIEAWKHYALALYAVGSRGEDYKHAVTMVKELLHSARYSDVAWAIDAAVFFGQLAHLDVFMDFHILTVQKFPQNPICWYNFGVAAHRIGRLGAALRLYSRAIDLDKQLTLAFVNRGLVHAVRGERPQAERDWRSAIAIDAGHEASKIAESLLQIAPGTEFTKALEERSPGRPGTTVNYLQTESPSNRPVI
jgi:Flp pilus assembly protein TadD